MPVASTDQQMIMDLQTAGAVIRECPMLKNGASQAEQEIHKAVVNNWRTKLFLSWQAVQNFNSKELTE